MKIAAVINYKVGKTSLTANLAAELAWQNFKVLMIDLDPQSSLTFSFITPDVWEKSFAASSTIKSWFESFESGQQLPLTSLIHTPKRVTEALRGREQLDIICSHLGLINVDLELATKLGGASLSQAKKNFITVHRQLARNYSPRVRRSRASCLDRGLSQGVADGCESALAVAAAGFDN